MNYLSNNYYITNIKRPKANFDMEGKEWELLILILSEPQAFTCQVQKIPTL